MKDSEETVANELENNETINSVVEGSTTEIPGRVNSQSLRSFDPLAPSPPPLPDLPVIEEWRYSVEEEYARGGLGRILAARDLRLDRPVAIKELIVPNDRAAARFVREALVSARLQHPSIVPVYDVGRWPSGELFYTMKLISGRSFREFIDEARTLDERLALVPHLLAVADAIAYAHSHQIIHRDLKPSNIMVGPFGETVVIDWGLAKDLARPYDDPPSLGEEMAGFAGGGQGTASGARGGQELTVAGVVLGTPQYMPPEQARAQPVDERADVYAIGAVLYHLLVGAAPYKGGTPAEVLEQVRKGPPLQFFSLPPGIPKDLAALVRKAMARSPDERYPTASELAEDLRRFLTGQLVSAHEYSRLTLFVRWLKRHRISVAVAASFLLLLGILGSLGLSRIVEERNIAEHERTVADHERMLAQARSNQLILVQAKSSLERDPTATLAWLKIYPAHAAESQMMRDLALDAWSRGVARHIFGKEEGKEFYSSFSPDGRLVVFADSTRHLRVWDLVADRTVASLRVKGELEGAKFSPDGKTLAFVEWESRSVWLWDLVSGQTRELGGHEDLIISFRFSPDGRMLLVGGAGSRLRLWTLGTGDSRALEGHDGLGFAGGTRFSPDSRLVAYPGQGNTLRLVDLGTGEVRVFEGRETALILDFSPDGQWLVSGGRSGTLWLWEVKTGKSRALVGHTRAIGHVEFSPDGSTVASASQDRTVRLWDLGTGDGRIVGEHQSEVTWVSFSPDGRILASAGHDATVRLWWPRTGDQRVLRGHTATIYRVQFSHDGQSLLSIGADRTTRVWELPYDPSRVLRAEDDRMNELVFSPNGQYAVVAGRNGIVWRWDVRSGEATAWRGHEKMVLGVAVSPNSKQVASVSLDWTVRLWDVASGETRILGRHEDLIWDTAFSPDGRRVASAAVDGTVRLWDISGQRARPGQVWLGHKGEIRSIAFSPDGTLLASGGGDGTVRLWRVATGESQVLQGHEQQVFRVAFSHDGRLLGSASGDGTVRLWDVPTGTSSILSRQHKRVRTVVFSPDDRLVALGGEDARVRLCEVVTGRCRVLEGHGDLISEVDFSPDGHLLASASGDGTVRLWAVDTGVCLGLHRHDAALLDVAFSLDGKLVGTTDVDKTARLWRVDPMLTAPVNPEAFRKWMAKVTSVTIMHGSEPSTPVDAKP